MAGKWKYVAAPKRHNMSQTDRGNWADKVKNEAIAIYLATGSPAMVSDQLNVPRETIRSWTKQQWWKDRVKEIQNEESDRLDSKLTKALDKALEQVMDRLENGEYMYDPRTGKVKQMPAKLRDLNTAFNSLLDKRQLIRKQPTKIVEQTSTAAQLQNLANQFASFVKGKPIVEKFDDLVDKVIEGETVELDETTGVYHVKETPECPS
jgi:uncharacterized protein YicC (UPF0701 family)